MSIQPLPPAMLLTSKEHHGKVIRSIKRCILTVLQVLSQGFLCTPFWTNVHQELLSHTTTYITANTSPWRIETHQLLWYIQR